MSAIPTIAGYALRESLRRKVFAVVLLLTAAFLALFWLGSSKAFDETAGIVPPAGIEPTELVGATLLGLAMFATLFLGTVLAVFLTLGAIRGDADRGLLQPLVVRPVGRSTFLLGRFLGAAGFCSAYVIAVFFASAWLTRSAGGWTPDRIVIPALELAVAVTILVALSLLGSVVLSSTANGIAVFMVFGGGLVSGLLGQIGKALQSDTLETVAHVASWVLPFEALYQDALYRITADTAGFTRAALQLGPFGGAELGGTWLPFWTVAYLALAFGAAALVFGRRDL